MPRGTPRASPRDTKPAGPRGAAGPAGPGGAEEPRQRALAQVHALGQLLHAAVVLAVHREPLEDLELAHAEPVLGLQLTLQRTRDACVAPERLGPGVGEIDVRRRCHVRASL